MSKAAELAALIGSGQAQGDKNLIINGNMAVSQRGTSHSYAHDGTRNAYNLDRFKLQMRNTSDEFDATVAQVSDSPDGFSNSLKMTTGTPESTVGADEYYIIEQRIEAQNLQHLAYGTSSAKATTLSFYVKSSVTGTFGCSFYQPDSVRIINKTYTIDSANTWERKIITVVGDTSGVIDNNNEAGLFIYWILGSGSDYDGGSTATTWTDYITTNLVDSSSSDDIVTTAGATWQVTGIQLEVGDVATPFEHESFAATLRKCHRYYIQGTNIGSFYPVGLGTASSGTSFRGMIPTSVEMRTVNTFGNLTGARGNGTAKTLSSHSLQEVTALGVGFNATSSSLTASQAYVVVNSASDGSEFYLDGEL